MPYFYSNGHKLHYREKGTGDLLLILPGNTASSANHCDDIEYFSKYFHTVALDFWGTGKSDRLRDWTREWWSEAAEDTANLIKHLASESAHIIGCSGGTAVAMLLAAKYPEKVRSIIADSELTDYEYDDMLRLCVETRNIPDNAQIDFWKKAHGDDWFEVVQKDNDVMLDIAANGHVFKDMLDDISCPVLFCGGLREEEYVPYFGDTLLDMCLQVEKAELYLVNDGDHPLMWTAKDKFRSMALAFLNRN